MLTSAITFEAHRRVFYLPRTSVIDQPQPSGLGRYDNVSRLDICVNDVRSVMQMIQRMCQPTKQTQCFGRADPLTLLALHLLYPPLKVFSINPRLDDNNLILESMEVDDLRQFGVSLGQLVKQLDSFPRLLCSWHELKNSERPVGTRKGIKRLIAAASPGGKLTGNQELSPAKEHAIDHFVSLSFVVEVILWQANVLGAIRNGTRRCNVTKCQRK